MSSVRSLIQSLEEFMRIPSGQEGRNARFAFYFLLAGGATFATYIPLFAYLQNWPLTAGMIFGTLGSLLGLYSIYQGAIRRAAMLAVTVGFVMINYNTVFVGGAFSVGDLFLIPTTFIAWVIFGHKLGLRLAALSIVASLLHLTFFSLYGNSFDLPLQEGSLAHAVLITAFKISLQLIIFSLIFIFSYFMNRALNEIQTLHASLSAMLQTDMETAIAIFDADYQLIEGSASAYYKNNLGAQKLFDLLEECEFEQASLVRDIVEIVHKQDQLTWLLNEGSLPHAALIHGKRHKLEWKPVFAKGRLDRLIFMAHSIEELWQAQAEVDKQTEEAHRLLLLVSLGSERVIPFVERARIQIDEALRCKNLGDIRHSFIALHTLKGASRMLGLVQISETIHELESQLENCQDEAFHPLELEFSKIETSCHALGYTQDALFISRRRAQNALIEGKTDEFLLDLIYPTVGSLILSYQPDVEKLARNLARPAPQLQLKKEGLRFHISHEARHCLNQSLVHIFRNTLDHSIESMDLRRELGKPETPTMTVHIKQKDEGLELGFSDDGQGLNLEKIRQRAQSLGYATETMNPQALAEVIFEPGFSTVDQISHISGRGVGMDAIRAAMQKIGGQARLRLLTEQGTHVSWELVLTVPYKECIQKNSLGSQRT